MSVKLSPLFNSQVVTLTGAPASGWKIYTYQAGSSAPLATYTDSTGTIPQSQPIVLNSLGFPTNGQIWLTSGQNYKLVLTDANDVVQKTEDNISGVNDTTTTVDEWSDSGLTPTYVSATSYTVVGDQTSALHIGRRQKFTVTAGTVYGRITNSVFTTLTTVTVQMDGSQVLDSGLTAVQNAVLRANVLSLPVRAGTASGTDTYTVALGLARYVKDDQYQVKISNANTSTTPTLNINSLGAQTIVNIDGTALYAGALNGEHTFRWNGTNMVVLNPTKGIEIFPPGAVVHFAMSTAPTGWLKANGATASRTTYSQLFTKIGTTFGAGDGSTTFVLPDLRGEFIRGFDDAKGTDPGRVFGSVQTDEFESHFHLQSGYSSSTGGSGTTGSVLTTNPNGVANATNGTGLTGSTETRPRNIALLACIKF